MYDRYGLAVSQSQYGNVGFQLYANLHGLDTPIFRLNTMLDFKVQNDVLQHRLAECRDRSLPESPDSRESPFAKVDAMYATSTLCVPKGIATSASAPMRTGGFANASQSNMAQGSMEGTRRSYPDTVELGQGSTYLSGLPAPSEDQGDESSKKKKAKLFLRLFVT